MRSQDWATGQKVILKFQHSSRILTGLVRAKSTSSRMLLVCFDDNRLEWLPMRHFRLNEVKPCSVINFDPTGKSY